MSQAIRYSIRSSLSPRMFKLLGAFRGDLKLHGQGYRTLFAAPTAYGVQPRTLTFPPTYRLDLHRQALLAFFVRLDGHALRGTMDSDASFTVEWPYGFVCTFMVLNGCFVLHPFSADQWFCFWLNMTYRTQKVLKGVFSLGGNFIRVLSVNEVQAQIELNVDKMERLCTVLYFT
jgi:hypothetical protein